MHFRFLITEVTEPITRQNNVYFNTFQLTESENVNNFYLKNGIKHF